MGNLIIQCTLALVDKRFIDLKIRFFNIYSQDEIWIKQYPVDAILHLMMFAQYYFMGCVYVSV